MSMSTPTPEPDAEDWVLIDVRSFGEYASGHVQGAINLPLQELTEMLVREIPDRARKLLMYCAAGGRSAMACQLARQLGYTNVVNGGSAGAVSLRLLRPVVRG
jgi:phage shock protein E